MEQLIYYRYKVIFDDSDHEQFFEHSWDAVHYAALNEGCVKDLRTWKTIADYRPEPVEYALYGG